MVIYVPPHLGPFGTDICAARKPTEQSNSNKFNYRPTDCEVDPCIEYTEKKDTISMGRIPNENAEQEARRPQILKINLV